MLPNWTYESAAFLVDAISTRNKWDPYPSFSCEINEGVHGPADKRVHTKSVTLKADWDMDDSVIRLLTSAEMVNGKDSAGSTMVTMTQVSRKPRQKKKTYRHMFVASYPDTFTGWVDKICQLGAELNADHAALLKRGENASA